MEKKYVADRKGINEQSIIRGYAKARRYNYMRGVCFHQKILRLSGEYDKVSGLPLNIRISARCQTYRISRNLSSQN
jgi:hypothetical protein